MRLGAIDPVLNFYDAFHLYILSEFSETISEASSEAQYHSSAMELVNGRARIRTSAPHYHPISALSFCSMGSKND